MTRKCNINRAGNYSSECSEDKGKPEDVGFWKRQAGKIMHRKYTCPLCREVCTGLSALGSHLKDHCT